MTRAQCKRMVNLEQFRANYLPFALGANFKLTPLPRYQNRTLGIRADTVRFSRPKKADTESRAKLLKPRVARRMIPSTI